MENANVSDPYYLILAYRLVAATHLVSVMSIVLDRYVNLAVAGLHSNLSGLQFGSVRFPLLLALAYAIGRDGVRRGCLRAASERDLVKNIRALIPLCYAGVAASLALFLLLSPAPGADDLKTGLHASDYTKGFILHAVSLGLEVTSEPWVILAMYRGEVVRESTIEVAARGMDAAAFWVSIASGKVSFSCIFKLSSSSETQINVGCAHCYVEDGGPLGVGDGNHGLPSR